MNIAIIGSPERAVAWEDHISGHRIIEEITITSTIEAIRNIDACLITDETDQNLAMVEYAIKMGWHCFLIAPIPINKNKIFKIAQFAEEAGVVVQFMHWPTLSHATKWMMNQMPKPEMLTIRRKLTSLAFNNLDKSTLRSIWIDELALCMRWMDSGIRSLDASCFYKSLDSNAGGLFNSFIRFNNGSAAGIFIYTMADSDKHQRIATNRHLFFNCDVATQHIQVNRYKQQNDRQSVEVKKFNPSKSAGFAVTQFLKAIQTGRPSPYNAHHAYQLCKGIAHVEGCIMKYG